MIDPADVPEVASDETVARYVLYSRHVRADQTVRADAFIPHPYPDMSVTRHYLATEAELWQVGENIASGRGLTLYGRGDVQVEAIRGQNLEIVPDPIDGNPNHANVTNWPAEKAEQKIIAAELAKRADYRPKPAAGASVHSTNPPGTLPAPAAPRAAAPTWWLPRMAAALAEFFKNIFRKISR
jgi:hypothetical protein